MNLLSGELQTPSRKTGRKKEGTQKRELEKGGNEKAILGYLQFMVINAKESEGKRAGRKKGDLKERRERRNLGPRTVKGEIA